MALTKPHGKDKTPGNRAKPGGNAGPSPLSIERVLPNSAEAEKAVLGAMLLNPQEAAPVAMERLDENHFYIAGHQAIFREIKEMQNALLAIDPVTLQQRLLDRNLLEEVGGAAYLAELVSQVPTTAHVSHYADIVYEKFLLRRLIEVSHGIITRSFDEQENVREWIAEVEQQVFSVNAERGASQARPVRELLKPAMESIEKMYEQRGALTGVPTGFRDLDRITSGLHASNMIVIAARPSMGKTSLAMNIAENVAIAGNPVGVFSLEMSAEELVTRMLCSIAKVNLRSLHDGFPKDSDHHRLTMAATKLMKSTLLIDDTAGLTIDQLRARARRMKLQHDIQLLVIDYLQLMRAPSRRADVSRQAETADISLGIKSMAKELKIPVIVLSQLNRQPEQREGNRPKLSDLRESGSIEQDADVVGLLVRPEMYADDAEERSAEKGKATLIIAKQRNGPTGDVELSFLSEYTRFENQARVEEEDVPETGGRQE